MKRLVLLGLIGLFISSAAFSQSFGDIYEKSIEDNVAIPYPFLREADVIWSKRIWRLVDMREKMNLPLYYPTTTTADGRMSLTNILLGEIKAGNINAFDANNMNISVTYSDIEKLMGAGADSIQIPTMSGVMKDTVLVREPRPDEVLQLLILEEWYFDKKHSRMDVRIIGLCPIRVYFNEELQKTMRSQLFWIRYDDFRDTFARHEIYNRFNDAQRVSYDDLFMQRKFSSIIYAESNVYDDRLISEYKLGKAALYEAERIKRELFEFEHDIWEY
jgi:gliding motility associated protien GldN